MTVIWFDNSTQMAGDCDKVKILTLVNAQIGSFKGFMLSQGQLKVATAKIYKISRKMTLIFYFSALSCVRPP